ncbi:hypothetical protein AXF42_Ash010527 [Apostasia shenzhenica]|uniref:Uncharacterized protein n=1 Tax=Apostasia shenzhenica TaxID=1088818 RepID=A0A2I0A6B6_9ASPA|nr:hypothetical protein AXF42_Ash010527 [Apostasia shenzhenica]
MRYFQEDFSVGNLTLWIESSPEGEEETYARQSQKRARREETNSVVLQKFAEGPSVMTCSPSMPSVCDH